MKKCEKCRKVYDDSWSVCLNCGDKLITGELVIDGQGHEPLSVSLVREKKEPLSSELIRFPKIWPGYILAALLFVFELLQTKINPQSSPERFSAWIFALGLIGLVYWNVCLYKIHKIMLLMADGCYPISPARAVGFGFIPFYNLYWIFKWPIELINFVKTRSDVKTLKPWSIGLTFLVSGIVSKIAGKTVGIEESIWWPIYFGVLSYLISALKRSLFVKPEPMPYKSKLNSGPAVGLIIACIVAIPITGLLAAIAIPNFVQARLMARANNCRSNLKLIQQAKILRARETGAANNATPSWTDLVPRYMTKILTCPSGGSYSLGSVDSDPKCSVGDNGPTSQDDHVLKK